ncbi:hypothetical protein F4802DRAFT_36990 [Xylaria palmicola]|nr:hypothetical protein F4802DRAFT_36990 [Xylaria palmicola]
MLRSAWSTHWCPPCRFLVWAGHTLAVPLQEASVIAPREDGGQLEDLHEWPCLVRILLFDFVAFGRKRSRHIGDQNRRIWGRRV